MASKNKIVGPKKKTPRKRRVPIIKRGDTVIVTYGKEKGNKGKVLSVNWKQERVVVEGLNMVTKHTKPNPQSQQGGITRLEASIHYSNIQIYNPTLGRGVRVRLQRTAEGVRQRVCVKTSEVLW